LVGSLAGYFFPYPIPCGVPVADYFLGWVHLNSLNPFITRFRLVIAWSWPETYSFQSMWFSSCCFYYDVVFVEVAVCVGAGEFCPAKVEHVECGVYVGLHDVAALWAFYFCFAGAGDVVVEVFEVLAFY